MANNIPSVGQLVIVRNRPARVTDVQPYSGRSGVTHSVELRYCDGMFYPETESVIWEHESNQKVMSKLALPDLSRLNLKPDVPATFNAYLLALKWSNHSSLFKQDTPEIISPWYSAVQVEDYQLYPVMKSVLSHRVSLLLADDVGLGKTIQAGLIMSELMRRRKIRKILIITPASLQTQWQEEMSEKFNLKFKIINLAETTQIYKEMGMDINPWNVRQKIITSMDYIRQPDILDQFEAAAEARMSGDAPTMPWDLLIVDEAHNMAPAGFGQESQRYHMLQRISKYFEHRIFLTATPHNGYTMSFTTLLSLLDPVRFTPKAVLDEHDRELISEVMVRRLKSEINEWADPPRFPGREVIKVEVNLTEKEIELFDALAEYRTQALDFLNRKAKRERNLGKFLFSLLTKRLLSSSYAFARTWWQHVEGMALEEEVDIDLAEQVQKRAEADLTDDEEKRNREEDAVRFGAAWMRIFGSQNPTLSAAQERVNQALIELGWSPEIMKMPLDQITEFPEDGRWDAFLNWLKEKLMTQEGFREDERVILFTEYLDTLIYLRQRFNQIKINEPVIQILYGDSAKRRELESSHRSLRDLIKREFNTKDSPLRILLATDVASEGLNFQYYCRYIFHQDIPWNPMRLEQRNGRVDRHNQSREVKIFHHFTDQQADLEFLARVVKKVNQVREDLGSVGQVFDEAFSRQFNRKKSYITDNDLDFRIKQVKEASSEYGDTRLKQQNEPVVDNKAFDYFTKSSEELGLNLDNLNHLFRVALELAGFKYEEEELGIFRLKFVPSDFQQLIDEAVILQTGKLQSALPKLTFDTSFFEQKIEGRTIFRTKEDTLLLRLSHPLVKRLLSFFEKQIWDTGKDKIKKWTITEDAELESPVYSVTCLYQATNELREIIISDVLTYNFCEENGDFVPTQYKSKKEASLGDEALKSYRIDLAEKWDELKKKILEKIESDLNKKKEELKSLSNQSLKTSLTQEKQAFENRKKYLNTQKGIRALKKKRREIEEQERKMKQASLFQEEEEDKERQLRESRWQLEEHERHINAMLEYVKREEKRLLENIIPKRYSVANIELQPIALKIIMGKN
jgi:ERCC4-related helicase